MKFTINNNLRLLTCPLLLAGAVCCSSGNDGDTPAPGPGPDPSPVTGDVLAYVTSADGNRLFTEEGLDYSKVSMSPYRVTIDPSTTYQTVDGFGPAITGATCYNLLQMSQADRTAILRKCFDPETGAGFSFIRVHIGGSDFSMDEYTCCDREGIEFFAIPAVEKDGIFPVLKEILEINPEIKIMGSPWSCPKWMKGTVADPSKPYDSWTGGRLNPAYYDDYAEYFVQWVTEMEENGFPIYAITMQNEPLNKGNSMSLYMPWEDQLAFVKKLGPAFRKAGIDTKILCYDHNYNYDNVAGQQNYPLNIYADADAAQLMPDDAVRGQHAFCADLLVSQAAQSRGNAGRLIKCEQPAAAFGLIAAQRIHQPVQCLLVGECAAERLHGFLTAQERRQQVEVVCAQLAVVHAAGV